VYELAFPGAGTPANHRQILPHWSMAEKLSNQCIPIRFGLRKEQHTGRKTIDAMYHKGLLSLQVQSCGKKRPGRLSIGAFNGHSRKSGRFIDGQYGIVFVKHDKLP